MKKLFLFLLAITGFSLTPAFAQVLVGSGTTSSYLVIESADFGTPLVYEFRYNYDPLSPLTTSDMLIAVDFAAADLSFELLYGGAFLNSVTYLSLTLTNSVVEPYSPFWAQWVSSGESGVPLAPMPDNVWSEGFGPMNRTLEPGSWDGFIFNGEYGPPPNYAVISAPPSVAPIPEPSTVVLLGLSTAGIFLWRRRQDVEVEPLGCLEGAR